MTRADHDIGSVNDGDFWFLLQSSILQVAGMVPVAFSLAMSKNAPLQPRIWSWFCLGSGFVLASLSPALYLVVPTEYSGLVACAASVTQVLIILEGMFLLNWALGRDGSKGKSA